MGRGRRMLDSRGVVCYVPAPSPGFGLVATDERRLMLEQSRAALHGVPKGVGTRLLEGVVLGGAIGGMTYFAASRQFGPQDARGSMALGVLLGVAAGFGGFRLTFRTPRVELVGMMLSRCRLCIVCGYDLSGTPAATDGCTVCPECGGAWRLGNNDAANPKDCGEAAHDV